MPESIKDKVKYALETSQDPYEMYSELRKQHEGKEILTAMKELAITNPEIKNPFICQK